MTKIQENICATTKFYKKFNIKFVFFFITTIEGQFLINLTAFLFYY